MRWCRCRRQGSEGSRDLRCGLLLSNLVRGSQGQLCDCFELLLAITLSTWAEPLRKKKWRSCSQTWHKDYATAVGDTTKAYFFFSNYSQFIFTRINACLGPGCPVHSF